MADEEPVRAWKFKVLFDGEQIGVMRVEGLTPDPDEQWITLTRAFRKGDRRFEKAVAFREVVIEVEGFRRFRLQQVQAQGYGYGPLDAGSSFQLLESLTLVSESQVVEEVA